MTTNPSPENKSKDTHNYDSIYNLGINKHSEDHMSEKLTSSEQIKSNSVSKSKKTLTFKIFLYYVLDLVLNLAIVLLLVLSIRAYLIAPFRVNGTSMCDTLNLIKGKCHEGNGDYIIVNKLGFLKIGDYEVGSPKRSDIIVFKPPQNDRDYFIKRIIGLPGDIVKIKNGKIFLVAAGTEVEVEIEEPYLNSRNKDRTTIDPLASNTFKVPENNYFVLGDNRRQSNDSRHCFSLSGCQRGKTHYLPRENIEGKAWVVLWPFSNLKVIK